MKKILITIAVLAVFLTLAGCGDGGGNADGPGPGEVTVNGVTVKLDENMNDVIADLGEADSVESAKSCLYDGYDRVFSYDGFRILTYPYNGEDHVDSVEIVSDKAAIASGVIVGDTVDAAKEKTGGDASESDTYLTYSYDGYGITYLIEDGAVREIDVFRQ